MSRVLLTGASGFIGSAALKALLRDGYEVHAVSSHPDRHAAGADPGVVWHAADLLDDAVAEGLVRAVKPELLLHLAWYVEHGRFWTSVENVRWVEATLRLLRAFANHEGQRAVLAGSCAEYEWTPQGGVLSEEHTALRADTLYGVSKNATYAVGRELAREAGFQFAWGRVFFLYGPGEPPGRLIPSVAQALLSGRDAEVTEGTQVRDFLHVRDVADAFAALLGSGVQGAVNIGSGEAIALREVVEAVAEATGRSDLVRFGAVPMRAGEPTELVADVRRLHEEVGFRPEISLREGIADTIAWWRERGHGSHGSAPRASAPERT